MITDKNWTPLPLFITDHSISLISTQTWVTEDWFQTWNTEKSTVIVHELFPEASKGQITVLVTNLSPSSKSLIWGKWILLLSDWLDKESKSRSQKKIRTEAISMVVSPPSYLGSLWWLRLNKTLRSNLGKKMTEASASVCVIQATAPNPCINSSLSTVGLFFFYLTIWQSSRTHPLTLVLNKYPALFIFVCALDDLEREKRESFNMLS